MSTQGNYRVRREDMERVLPTLFVGLGNPGPEYAETRHNVGFKTIDRLVAMTGPVLETRHRYDSELTRVRVGGKVIMLVKPLTYMNRSGEAVGKILKALDLQPEETFIIYDCLDLPLGRMRIRTDGGSGGHRGMESILKVLGTQDIPRLRIGIGRNQDAGVVDHVLSAWDHDERIIAEQVVDAAADAAIVACRAGITRAMNTFNRWTAKQSDGEKIDDQNRSEAK